MRGFETVEAAARFCCAFDELQHYFRQRLRIGEIGFSSRTTTSFLGSACSLASPATSSLIGRDESIQHSTDFDEFLCSQF
jgi:hypothetical protein